MSDIDSANWNIQVNNNTITICRSSDVIRTVELSDYNATIGMGFSALGVPRNITGTFPFTVNSVTGYFE